MRFRHRYDFQRDGEGEAVATLGEGLDGFGTGQVGAEDGAELGDVLGDVGFFDEGVVPDAVAEGLAADDLASVFDQEMEDGEGLERQSDDVTRAVEDALLGIKGQFAKEKALQEDTCSHWRGRSSSVRDCEG